MFRLRYLFVVDCVILLCCFAYMFDVFDCLVFVCVFDVVVIVRVLLFVCSRCVFGLMFVCV